ncbi:hypothetical protein T4B_1636 [Trichinella pseudospiralis]|uniref:Uncharacterized protein n=1 Tax=Trichinella pseudospiralis TaxID=6337 RepID=A0A0V1IY20_TRIPS|nr:hypothetical protein T4B_1636 [Trichinella pseudospiralis]
MPTLSTIRIHNRLTKAQKEEEEEEEEEEEDDDDVMLSTFATVAQAQSAAFSANTLKANCGGASSAKQTQISKYLEQANEH